MALNTSIRGRQIKDAFFGAGLIRNSGDNDVMDINVDDSSIEISSDALQIKALGVTNAMLAGSISDDKLATDYIQTSEVDDSSIEFSGGTLNVKAGGVTNDMLAGSIADGKLASDYIQTSEVDDSTIEFNGGTLNVKAGGIGATELDETDNYTFSGTVQVTQTPSADNDVANKAYVDNVASGLDWKDAVVAKGTVADGNITLSGVSGQSLDGIALSADDRVLLTEQTDASQNGIWVVKSGAWERPSDYATGDGVASSAVFIEQGSTYGDTGWVCTNDSGSDVVGTDNLAFTQFTGTGTIVAGSALSKDGNTLNVNVDDSSIEVNGSDQLQVKAGGITNAMLAGSIADDKLVEDYIKTSEVDGTTIEFSGSTLNVVAGGIDTTQLANDSVDKDKINADVAGNGLGQNVDGSLEVNVDDSSIEISADTLQIKAGGVTDAMLATDYIQTSEVDGTTIEFSGGTLNIVNGGVDTTQLADGAVSEAKMDIFNAPSTGKVLGYTSNGLEWVSGTEGNVNESDIIKENESANCNGATTDFNLDNTPIANSVQVYLNGLLQEEGSGKDYTLSGSTVSFAVAPLADDILIMHYIIDN